MELLSPAGNLETAIAAFDGGADAVYCGLGRFNARERAENFTPETLGKLLNFSRAAGKKVYLTLNTLVWEKELGALFEQLLMLDKFRPDALIVQDPGVIAIVRKYFPQLPLHASTQMGIHNSAGVALAHRLGMKRVILERQITLNELRLIAQKSKVELEVFLHGSLCCSLSGRCLFSHHLYGESSNRGRCKQPCRRAFSQKNARDMRIFSPADLAGNTLLEELDKTGIASLKIEGRLRTPDYIWKTARAYRLLLDNPGDPDAAREADNIFRTVPGRKKSTGFYFKRDWKELIDPSVSGTFGECCATVEKVIRSGMLVKVRSSLHLGDRLRVMPLSGGDGESFTLAAMENHRREKIIRAKSKETVFISGKFRAAAGYEIRRIGENGFDFSRRAAALPLFRREIPLKLRCSANMWHAEIPGITEIWKKHTSFAPAEKQPFSPEKAAAVFAEALPPGFAPGKISADVDGSFFVPAAVLKTLRRECWEFFSPHLEKLDFFPEHPVMMEKFYAETHAALPHPAPIEKAEKSFDLPPFIPETGLDKWRTAIRAAYADGTRDFTVNSWHAFELLRDLQNIRIHVRYPFHISNSFAVKLAAELGAVSAVAAPECDEDNYSILKQNSVLSLDKENAPQPLLVSRLPLT
ncbi:MAG: DUF3656 domain-containing protein, partial [Lentisphaeria bacterium]|nr:DUF3656 domain-containing protein [Lentisphaeria bacterium]